MAQAKAFCGLLVGLASLVFLPSVTCTLNAHFYQFQDLNRDLNVELAAMTQTTQRLNPKVKQVKDEDVEKVCLQMVTVHVA